MNVRKLILKVKLNSFPPNNIKLIIGSGRRKYSGWISTDKKNLNIMSGDDWAYYFNKNSVDNILSEHVFEHFTEKECLKIFNYCHTYLKEGGCLRIAVPDGYNPNIDYIEYVKPGGYGCGSDDHKLLYNYETLSNLLNEVGFKAELIEYWDENGRFNFVKLTDDRGHIHRSKDNDPRNKNGDLNYTSLIIDAIK
ncbi:hypothetical protein V7O62_12065 [Methanolobus sp. ZRKC2]|uniref:class I SAM-dependent methyltransferase n=1 Tax=Methanolobus sp. ZRKC2 TaxID=3125783 RepID=UPI00324BAF69